MPIRCIALLLTLSLLASCAPVSEHKVWRDSNYSGGPLGKVFVIGLSANSLADQRGFEDMMVGQIRAAGGEAVPGYQFVPAGSVPDDAVIAGAVARAGADGVLLSRMTGVRSYGSPLQNPYPSLDVAARPNSPIYAGPGSPQVEVATIYTTLFAANGMNPIFTYDPKSYDPYDFEQQAPAYARLVVSYMQSNGFLRTQMLPR